MLPQSSAWSLQSQLCKEGLVGRAGFAISHEFQVKGCSEMLGWAGRQLEVDQDDLTGWKQPGGGEGSRGKSRQVCLLWARQAYTPAVAFWD